MLVLIYLHGFLSSPESKKAQSVQHWLTENRPDIKYLCPKLSTYPGQAISKLRELMSDYSECRPMLMGSSLGGYWATWLAEYHDLPALLINPAVKPSILLPEYLDVELKNFHTHETYILVQEDVKDLIAVDVAEIQNTENYWLMLQTGDESLDYRHAVKKYAGCRQLVEEGGDHGFTEFERWIPSAVSFLEQRRTVIGSDKDTAEEK